MSKIKILYRWVDLLAGLYVGAYRSGYSTVRPTSSQNQNENVHYLLSEDQVAARIRHAKEGAPLSTAYATAFWMEKALRDVADPLVCDFGGGYGPDYFRFTRLLSRPMRWAVSEIPEITEHAKQMTALREIAFVNECPRDADLLYSNGVVMNADGALLDAISSARPGHLIITGVECVPTDTFYTWQINRRTKRKCVYVTHNHREFALKIEAMGYDLLGDWEMGKSGSGVFLKSGLDVNYYGFAFKKASSGSAAVN